MNKELEYMILSLGGISKVELVHNVNVNDDKQIVVSKQEIGVDNINNIPEGSYLIVTTSWFSQFLIESNSKIISPGGGHMVGSGDKYLYAECLINFPR